MHKKIVVAISGASGAIYGIRLLEVLKSLELVKTHLIVSDWGFKVIDMETGVRREDVIKLSDFYHDVKDLGAPIASGSFQADAMVIVPCSMKTLSAIAHGFADNLISRSADVMLKEKRPLIVVPRETPLNMVHLENMSLINRAGGIIMPAMPSFYHNPVSIEDFVVQFVCRILDVLRLPQQFVKRWGKCD